MILITGITGKSGKYLWQKLEKDEQFLEANGVRLLARNESKLEVLNIPAGIERAYCDINDSESLESAMVKVDTVLHIAGIHTSLKIAEAASRNIVKWLILVHTTGIYSKYKAAGEEYRNTELKVEKIAKRNGILLTILRPTMIYGSINDNNMIIFIKMVDRMKILPVVNGALYELQPVHAKDLGDAYYQVLKNESITKGKEYILSGKQPILLMAIFSTIADMLDRRPFYVSVPFPFAYAGAWMTYLLTFGKVDYREKVQRLVEPRVFSHEKATHDFSYSPMAFADGIRDEIEEYMVEKSK